MSFFFLSFYFWREDAAANASPRWARASDAHISKPFFRGRPVHFSSLSSTTTTRIRKRNIETHTAQHFLKLEFHSLFRAQQNVGFAIRELPHLQSPSTQHLLGRHGTDDLLHPNRSQWLTPRWHPRVSRLALTNSLFISSFFFVQKPEKVILSSIHFLPLFLLLFYCWF